MPGKEFSSATGSQRWRHAWHSFKLLNSNFKLPPPLSCRWRSDWLPCHPSLTIGGIRDRRFQFCTLLTDQQPRWRLAAGNVRTCANHAAAMAMVPELDAILSPPVQNSFSATARSSTRATRVYRTVRTINVTRRVLGSPEEANSRRSSWLTGDLEHSALRCTYLTWTSKRTDPFDLHLCPLFL